jgi:hypothetical protein
LLLVKMRQELAEKLQMDVHKNAVQEELEHKWKSRDEGSL